jgi:enoyl-CoA hydratase
MPGWGLTVILPQWIGVNRARQMSITGNYVLAQQALQWGLVNEVVTAAELLPRASALAAAAAAIEPRAVTHMLHTYQSTTDTTAGDAWDKELQCKQAFDENDGGKVAQAFDALRARGSSQQAKL